MPHPAMPDPQAYFLDGPELPEGVTRFWLIRHGIVDESARQTMYGSLDVDLCPVHLASQQTAYRHLAQRIPDNALWLTSPLKRARDTGHAIRKEGSFMAPLTTEPSFIEQSMGEWNGVPHEDFPDLIKKPTPPFWSIAADERPPQGESMSDVRARVGAALESLAQKKEGNDMVILSHGGAIRMALAHCLNIPEDTALRFTIQNLSLTIIEHIARQWRVIAVNELPAFGETA